MQTMTTTDKKKRPKQKRRIRCSVTVHISPDQKKKLIALAYKENVTVSQMVRWVMVKGLIEWTGRDDW